MSAKTKPNKAKVSKEPKAKVGKTKDNVVLNITPVQPKKAKKIRTTKKKTVQEPEVEIISTEYDSDYRQIMMDYDPSKNKSPPILSIYEVPLMIGKRATQIAYGAHPLIEIKPGMTHIDIAEGELRQKKIPFMIRRHVGGKPEYWRIEDLEVDF